MAMMKYHNSPDGPKPCSANIRECKYAQAGDMHYGTYEQAQAAYEQAQVEKYGETLQLSKATRATNSVQRAYYTRVDRARSTGRRVNRQLQAKIKLAKASPQIQEAKANLEQISKRIDHEYELAVREGKQMMRDANKFKNRIVGKARFGRMRAKMFISERKDQYTAITSQMRDRMISTKNGIVNKKNNGANRMKNAVTEGKNRFRAASQHQKAAMNALRNSSPEALASQHNRDLIKLNEAMGGRIDTATVDAYFKSMQKANQARGRRASGEVKEFSQAQGRRRAAAPSKVNDFMVDDVMV